MRFGLGARTGGWIMLTAEFLLLRPRNLVDFCDAVAGCLFDVLILSASASIL